MAKARLLTVVKPTSDRETDATSCTVSFERKIWQPKEPEGDSVEEMRIKKQHMYAIYCKRVSE